MNEPKDFSGGWDGYRTFCVERKEPESLTVTSFYLTGKDERPLASYKPGQFLTLAVPSDRTGVAALSRGELAAQG